MLKHIMLKFGMAIATFALMITSINVNSTCALIQYQPELPEGAQKLKKIN